MDSSGDEDGEAKTGEAKRDGGSDGMPISGVCTACKFSWAVQRGARKLGIGSQWQSEGENIFNIFFSDCTAYHRRHLHSQGGFGSTRQCFMTNSDCTLANIANTTASFAVPSVRFLTWHLTVVGDVT